MHLTFHTTIRDEVCQDKLGQMASYHSRIERKLYAAIAAGKFNPSKFKQDFCERYQITSRQFNAMALEVKGKIAGTQESLQDNIETKQSKLKILRNAVSDLKSLIKKGVDSKGRVIGAAKMDNKKRNLHEKKRKIGRLEHDLKAFEARLAAPVPGICFGSRKLFLQQFKDDSNFQNAKAKNKASANSQVPEQKTEEVKTKAEEVKTKAEFHAAWSKEWKSARDSQFLIVGTGEEQAGCAGCQASLEEDGTITLKVRPFNFMLEARSEVSGKDISEMKRRKTLTVKTEDLIVIRGVKFSHGTKYIHDAIARNQGLDKTQRTPFSFRFLKADSGLWYVHLSLDVPETAVFNAAGGAIGIDFNEDHIATTVVNKSGNFITCRRFDLNLYGVSSLEAKDKIRCVAKEVVAWAKDLGLPIVAEDLDFQKKKKSMAGMSAKRSRQLSSLHYSSWGAALKSRCLKDSVALKLVNPAYSSLIGRVKFSHSCGLSVHHAAAMVIARRGMGFSERLPHSSVVVSNGMGSHNTLNPVANMGHRHVWGSWARQAKTLQAARVALLSEAKALRQRRQKLTHKATSSLSEPCADDCVPF